MIKNPKKILFLPQVAKFRLLRCINCGSFLGWREYSTDKKDMLYCRKCRDFVEAKETGAKKNA